MLLRLIDLSLLLVFCDCAVGREIYYCYLCLHTHTHTRGCGCMLVWEYIQLTDAAGA